MKTVAHIKENFNSYNSEYTVKNKSEKKGHKIDKAKAITYIINHLPVPLISMLWRY